MKPEELIKIMRRSDVIMDCTKMPEGVPEKCPITGLPYFMTIEHPDLGEVPTYGGPYYSYTIPELDDEGFYCRYKYDHDEGCWDNDIEAWEAE